MDSTTLFFSKLKKLAVTLESETAKLQHSFQNRHNNRGDDDDNSAEATAKTMRAYHELNCEVGTLKGQIQGQVAQQRAQENKVSNHIRACRVMEQKVAKDILTLRDHWEKYGYKAPKDAQRPADDKSQESETEDQVADENDSKSGEEEEEDGGQEEAGDASPVRLVPPPVTDVLRTPQLSDFGLSEIQIKRAVAGPKWAEAPPMPEITLPHPSLNTPAPPPMPITPKCALRMDDNELHTPQMNDFGISEDTMFLNNDFTMNLVRKNAPEPSRAAENKPAAPVNALKESLLTKAEDLESPEPPMICTPGFKIRKSNVSHCTLATPSTDDPESPDRPGNLAATPEVPAFKTPHLNRLVSAKKSAPPAEPIAMQPEDDGYTFHLPTPCNEAARSKRPWEYNVPEFSVLGEEEDKEIPEMPNLESDLGNSLRSRSAKIQKKASEYVEVTNELKVHSLNLDSPTQDFSLGTACFRMDNQDPSTPEMPDLSSVTQEICKTRLKTLEAAIVHKKVQPEKHRNSSVSLPVVSEREFQSLPSYLRQMNLHNLNQVVHNINKFSAEFQGEKTEFQLEELRRISNVGAKTPIYLLCLTELKRLEQMGGARNTSVYKLITHA